MRILLVGNFSTPHEEENLHSLTLLDRLRQEGHKCHMINIAESPSENKEVIHAKNYLDFIIKLILYGYRCNVIHFLTKGYVRPGLMKLVTTVFIGKSLLKKVIITLHPEMFSIFGQLRSKMGGQQLLHLSFSLADKIICGDTHTFEIAFTHYNVKDKFEVIPTFIQIPEETEEMEMSLKKLKNKKKIVVFSGVKYPSLIFDILTDLLNRYLESETGIAIAISDKNSAQIQHTIEGISSRFKDNMVFIESTDTRLLPIVYAKADLVMRTLSCDGKPLFNNIAITVKKPQRSENYLYFPLSLTFIKEGEVADLCAYIFNNFLIEKAEKLPELLTEDFYAKIKEIYSK
jgi:hypothetical protein